MDFGKKNNSLKYLCLLMLFFSACSMPSPQTPINISPANQAGKAASPSQRQNATQTETQQTQSANSIQLQAPVATTPSGINSPLADAMSRITKKPFGAYVSPLKSPVEPEEFIGYHAGTDFEVFPDEVNKDVPVSAICAGTIKIKRMAQGYGGVVVESCNLDGQDVTVSYGHLKLTSIAKNVGDDLAAGESFALLGDAYSPDTGGERKHLHLGIKKGTIIDLHGYVQDPYSLSDWLDFRNLISSPESINQ